MLEVEDNQYPFAESERPNVAGAPYLPPHALQRRIRYVLVAIFMSISGIFGNSLVTGNLAQIAGGYLSYSADTVWLIGAYVGVGASANIVMIKGRQQLGLPMMLFGSLILYVLAAAADAVFGSLTTAVLARAANGLSTSTGVAASVYYMMSALPKSRRILAVATPIACVQLAQPLARLVPVDFLLADRNTTLHLLILVVPLLQIIVLALNPLPRTYTIKVFERLDLLTGPLVLAGFIMLACALAAGETYWWTETPFLGYLLIGSALTLGLAVLIESRRTHPEIDLKWLTNGHIAAFMGIALVERLSLGVQSSSVPGLLSLRSLNNDQYHTLFAMVALSMVVGILVMLCTLSPRSLLFQMMAALGCIAMGAMIACSFNELVRPDDLIISQCLIGFGTTLFVGPALFFCISQMLKRGTEVLVPTVLVFAATQNFGSVVGSALLSSVQFVSQKYSIAGFDNRFAATNPVIAQWSSSTLSSTASQQASVIGYLNSFRLVTVIALAAMVVVMIAALYTAYTNRAQAQAEEKTH
ncbi:hypothetical protein [Pseudomonas sp. dw_358]|uniref:hypothetical protein n=1 Tax=Pseudomonas sp. dw_358 TaxID=2720083 RepID=UPI001BD6C3A7|nr:hypothetical protein [Pseudomonas sp. dw_358]